MRSKWHSFSFKGNFVLFTLVAQVQRSSRFHVPKHYWLLHFVINRNNSQRFSTLLNLKSTLVIKIWNNNHKFRLHRYWWRMLDTKCVGDNFEMLVTVLPVFVTNILYLLTLASGPNIQKKFPISKFCH